MTVSNAPNCGDNSAGVDYAYNIFIIQATGFNTGSLLNGLRTDCLTGHNYFNMYANHHLLTLYMYRIQSL
jgi:hypothetical protein